MKPVRKKPEKLSCSSRPTNLAALIRFSSPHLTLLLHKLPSLSMLKKPSHASSWIQSQMKLIRIDADLHACSWASKLLLWNPSPPPSTLRSSTLRHSSSKSTGRSWDHELHEGSAHNCDTFCRLLDPRTIHDVQNATSIAVFKIRQKLGREQETPEEKGSDVHIFQFGQKKMVNWATGWEGLLTAVWWAGWPPARAAETSSFRWWDPFLITSCLGSSAKQFRASRET